MRPRTKSIVTAREYFREESAYAGSTSASNAEEDWMQIAMRGSSKAAPPHSQHSMNSSIGSLLISKGRKRGGSNESNFSSRSTLPSWDENDPDFVMDDCDDEEDDDDEDVDGVSRRRRCSHTRRISFDDDVSVVTIPARSSFDAEYKRRVWYSMEDLSKMRELM